MQFAKMQILICYPLNLHVELLSSCVTMIAVDNSCLPGWSIYKESCYKYVLSSQNWAASRDLCLWMGADLATVHDLKTGFLLFRVLSGQHIFLSVLGILCIEQCLNDCIQNLFIWVLHYYRARAFSQKKTLYDILEDCGAQWCQMVLDAVDIFW